MTDTLTTIPKPANRATRMGPVPMTREQQIERFWSYVDRRSEADCWPWMRSARSDGYGQFLFMGRNSATHRLAYEFLVGPIPMGLQLDHICHVPGDCVGLPCPHRLCVNPSHLRPVTARENVLRSNSPVAQMSSKTRCIHGHEFTPENTHITKRGARSCRECNRLRGKANYERRVRP